MKTQKTTLLLQEHYDYMSVIHTNWRFTMGRSGEKASGTLARDKVGFNALLGYITSERKAGRKNGEIMRSLADEKVLPVVWPAWNTVVFTPDIKVGDSVRVGPDAGGILKRCYPGVYEVGRVAKKYAYLNLPAGQLMGLEKTDLVLVPKTV